MQNAYEKKGAYEGKICVNRGLVRLKNVIMKKKDPTKHKMKVRDP
jgi:hypothetical protein